MTAKVAFDHTDTGISDELFEWGRRLRAESPLAYTDAHGGFWVASRYDDIAAITKDHKSFSSAQGITIPPLANPVPSIPAESDEPWHHHYRAVLAPFLTPGAVREYEPVLRSLVTEAIDSFIERGEADAVADLAAQIPTLAMARVFGFSERDAQRLDEGFAAVVEAAGTGDIEVQTKAVGDFMAFLNEKIEEGRSNPERQDVVSAMVKYEAEGRQFTQEECLGLLWSTAGAAVDTTRHAIGHALHGLARDKNIRQQLIEDSALISAAVDEALRLDPPAFAIARTAVREVTVGDVTLNPGDRVLVVYGWANRDDSAFVRPDEIDLQRAPNPHLTFGNGIHRCLGMHLARLEVRIVIEEVLERLPDYELASDPGNPRLRGGIMWGFDSLPITFTPGVKKSIA